jgi:hypothetical protein
LYTLHQSNCHPLIDIHFDPRKVDTVSRDRSKLFREAASRGAPQARQIADRFHLQQNLAEALQDFFRHHERVLKKKLLHKYYNGDDVVVSGGGRSILLIFVGALVAALCT